MIPFKYCNKHKKSIFPAVESVGCKDCEKLNMESEWSINFRESKKGDKK